MSAERNCPRSTFKSIRRKKGLKNAKKDPKTIRNAIENILAPLRPLKNISPALFSKFKKFFTAQNLHKQKTFRRGSAGVSHAKIWVFLFGLADLGKLPAKFSANLQQLFSGESSALFLQGFRPPKNVLPPKLMPKIVGIPPTPRLFFEQKKFSRQFSA